MRPSVHLLKLCVGTDSIAELADWHRRRGEEMRALGRDPRPVHVTRMWPKRADELIDGGGSLYWVFKGMVLGRQRILALDPRDGADGIRRCGIVLDAEIVPVVPQPRRPFQGWRYLRPEDAPRDLDAASAAAELPPKLMAELSDIGVL